MDRLGPVGLGAVLGAWTGAIASPEAALAVLCLALGLALALLHLRRDSSAAFLLAGLAIGALSVATQPAGPRLRGPVSVIGVVSLLEGGKGALVHTSRFKPLRGDWSPTRGQIRVRFPASPPPVGTPVLLFGEASAPHHQALPGATGGWIIDELAALRTTLVATLASTIDRAPPPTPLRPLPGLLHALATGDRSQVEPALVQSMRDTGTAHLLAISGFHVGTIALVAGWIGHRLAALRALHDPYGVPAHPGRLAATAAAVLFTISVGAPVSAVRACLMVGLVAFATATGRRINGPAILGAAAIPLVVHGPAVVATVSFQLSFGAVLGLLTWGSVIDRYLPPDLPWWVDSPLRAAWVSVAATLGTLPGSAWWFQSLSLTSPLANVLTMPLASFVLVPTAMIGAWVPGPIGDGAVWIGAQGITLMEAILTPLALPPTRPAIGPIGALGLFAALATAREPRLGFVMGLLLLGLRARPCDRTVLTFLDVGQGDAIVVQHPDGRTDLYDTGTAWSGAPNWLRREGLYRIDRLVLTHADADHAGAAPEILSSFAVGALYTPHLADDDPARLAAQAAGVPIVTHPDWRLFPTEPVELDDNTASAVVPVLTEHGSVLLTGDVPGEAEQALAPSLPPFDVLKLAHHGSATSTTDALLTATLPRLAIAQLGWNNRYGHPARSVRRRLLHHHVPLLRTDLHGTIQLELGANGVRVRHWLPRAGWSSWTAVPEPKRPAAPTT